jgi:hypothetical protein
VRKHLGKLILLVVLSCIVAVVLIYRHMDNTIRNSYAQWWVADMVTLHLSENEQQWPRSWSELRDDYDLCVKRSGKSWTFEDLSARVTVDWSIDTDTLRSLPSNNARPPFRVIWATDGSSAHWESREPNAMIAEYLTLHPAVKEITEQKDPPELRSAPD